MATDNQRILFERKGPLAVIRLNRPEARNACPLAWFLS